MATIITNAGKAKIAEALASGSLVKLKYIAVGDGNGEEVIPDPYMTELVNEVYRGVITKYEIQKDNPNALVLYLTIPSTVGGFTIREIGCFDINNTLFSVTNTDDIVKPAPKDGYKNLTIRCVVTVTSSEQGAIEVNIDPNFTIVQESAKSISKDTVKLHEENLEAHSEAIDEKIHQHNIDPNSHKDTVVPIGGFKNQVLTKASDTDRDLVWKFVESTEPKVSGSGLVKDSTDNYAI